MVLKKFYRAAEGTFLIGGKVYNKIGSISKKLFLEAIEFGRRNKLVEMASSMEEPAQECCPRCLKAHLLKKAGEMNDGRAIREIILEMADYQTGHCGYYLDGEKVIKL